MSSCGNSVTNVWDYYIKNNVEQHRIGQASTSKSKLLYRQQESVSKSQLELIAYKQDTLKYLVIGSHKVAKSFLIYDSIYHFDVSSIYSRVRGDDFIRQMGDLSIHFAHLPADLGERFTMAWPDIKNRYMQAKPGEGETVYIDYTLSSTIFLSFPKTAPVQEPAKCDLWVGRRKHEIRTEDLQKALADLKAFK